MRVSSSSSASGVSLSSRVSRAMSACSASVCELTATYSPAAMDIAPATRPARPAIKISGRPDPAAATPTTRLAVETRPSLAPSTAARNQPMRCTMWTSECDSLLMKDPLRPSPPTAFLPRDLAMRNHLLARTMISVRQKGQRRHLLHQSGDLMRNTSTKSYVAPCRDLAHRFQRDPDQDRSSLFGPHPSQYRQADHLG